MRCTLLAPLALVAVGAVACGGASADAPPPATAVVAPPPLAPPPPASPPPASPPPALAPAVAERPAPPAGDLLAKQATGEKPTDAEGATAAEPSAAATADAELETMRTAAAVEARANAEQLAKDKLKWAKMGREIERRAAYEDALDRLRRANARVAAAQNKLSRVPAARRGQYNTDMATYGTRKADVERRMSSIHAYGSDEWRRMRDELYGSLDELDMAAARVENNLF